MKLNLNKYEAVIFDMDGTMVDNMKFHNLAWNEFRKRHGSQMSDEEFFRKTTGRRNDFIFEILFGRQVVGDEYKKLDEEKEGIYRELYRPHLKAVPGLIEFLNRLKETDLKIGVATTSPNKNRTMVLEALNLHNFFEIIIGGEDTKQGKPHPEIYLKTAEGLGIDPIRCLAFEDTASGIKSAKDAGMTVVAVLTSHTKEELSEADYFIKDFTEVQI